MRGNEAKGNSAVIKRRFAVVCAALFMAAPGGVSAATEMALYSFTGGSDGGFPLAGLIGDSNGNLYGTTYYGGTPGCTGLGCGVVFKLAPQGPSCTPVSPNSMCETVLHSFCSKPSCSDGALPRAGLITDRSGNLYGTTVSGGSGCYGAGCGVVFKIAPDGTEKVLYSFTGGSDGADPFAGLIADSNGNLYGTAEIGGGLGGNGVVFKLSPPRPSCAPVSPNLMCETVLRSYCSEPSCSDGANPEASLIADSKGNLYGTTVVGGGSGCPGFGGCGTVFKLAPDGTSYMVLYSFTGGSDGGNPQAGLIADSNGNLYGTTFNGGVSNGGTIFELMGTGFAVFAGTPGTSNCQGKSISMLAQQYGGLAAAAAGLGYPSVAALQNAIRAWCAG
jgi:uncharacterized repeat protein (TIGR03803 family)